MSKAIFITGTGTDIGKTFVTGLILKKLRESGADAAYYKAAISGNDVGADGKLIPGDPAAVKAISGVSQPLDQMCPYVYKNAYSPHLAARIEGEQVDMEKVMAGYRSVCNSHEFVTVEGSGGIVCPIRWDTQHVLLEDIVKAMELPCIIVADAGLGTINSTVLTCEYLKRRSIAVSGIILNHFHKGDVMQEDNLAMCRELTGVDVIACVSDGADCIDIDPALLKSLYKEVEA